MGICLTACNSAEVDDITNSSTDVVSSIEAVSDVSATEDSISIDSSNVSSSEEVVENEEVDEEEELGEKLSFLDSPTSPIIISKTESVYTEDGTLVFSNTFEYYDDGSLKTVTADDGTTEYTYDEYGNIIEAKDDTAVITYEYDEYGNVVKQTMSYGEYVVTEYQYLK